MEKGNKRKYRKVRNANWEVKEKNEGNIGRIGEYSYQFGRG